MRFLLALDRLSSRTFRPVSGSFWMNFFSTYFERIHDSFSPLKGQKRDSGAFTSQKDANGKRKRGGASFLTEEIDNNKTLFPYLRRFLSAVAQQPEKEEAAEKRRFDRQKRKNFLAFFYFNL